MAEGEEFDKEALRRLHAVILEGFDPVKDLIRENIKINRQIYQF